MEHWQIIATIGVILLILEMFTPTLFFINMAAAAFVAAFFSFCGYPISAVVIIFFVLSIVAIVFIRPIFLRYTTKNKQETGLNDKYIGKCAKVIKEVTHNSGRLTIYGEEWEARLKDDNAEPISEGAEVKIICNDNITFYVEKV